MIIIIIIIIIIKFPSYPGSKGTRGIGIPSEKWIKKSEFRQFIEVLWAEVDWKLVGDRFRGS